LLDIARTSKSFVTPHFMFLYHGNVYVGSEVVYTSLNHTASNCGLTLADMIDSTLPMTETQAATVLKQVGEMTLEACPND
jgi:hypothetical protein